MVLGYPRLRELRHAFITETVWLLFGKIFIVKNIWRDVENLEAHLLMALVAAGEGIAAMHHSLMRGPMLFMVNYLIDSALWHSLSGLEK
jgi:hypothetical protein